MHKVKYVCIGKLPENEGCAVGQSYIQASLNAQGTQCTVWLVWEGQVITTTQNSNADSDMTRDSDWPDLLKDEVHIQLLSNSC